MANAGTVALIALVLLNILFFATILTWSVIVARRTSSRHVRLLAGGQAALCVPFLLGAVQRLGFQLIEVGLRPQAVEPFLKTVWQWVLGATALVVGGVLVYLLRRVFRLIEQGDRLVTVMTERVPLDASVSDYGLTPRELEILELIASGVRSDRDISEELYISPATANTHVKNILRKTGLNSRQDLVVLASRPR